MPVWGNQIELVDDSSPHESAGKVPIVERGGDNGIRTVSHPDEC